MIDLSRQPFPITYRELWLPPSINGNASLPSSVSDGHGLTLTGARLGSTCEGIHPIDDNSNISIGNRYNGINTLWISMRFKLDVEHNNTSAAQWLYGRFVAGTDYTYLVLWSDGQLRFTMQTGGTVRFDISPSKDTWAPDVWWWVLASMSAGGAKLYYGNEDFASGPYTSPYVGNNPAGVGNDVFGNLRAAYPGEIQAVLSDIFAGTDTLTEDEVTDLRLGMPPSDAVTALLCDEGRGTTAYDRGSGGWNGTITNCNWAWRQVEQPALSFDAQNDSGQSSAGVNASGDKSLVWVGKLKAVYSSDVGLRRFFYLYTDADNRTGLSGATDGLAFFQEGNGTLVQVTSYAPSPDINSYVVIIGVCDETNGNLTLYVNGSPWDIASGVTPYIGAAIAYIGNSDVGTHQDISKPLFIALIDGAFTDKQALVYSRWLKDVFNLPISI